MGDAVYAIDAFPDDDFHWRIEWIGGLGYNTSAPSDPLIDVCLAQLPVGETNPLSVRSRSSQTKRTVKIGVGLLPYIANASVWQQRRPVLTHLSALRQRLRIDTSWCRTVALGDLIDSVNAIPRSSYLFGASWPHVRRTLLVTVEQSGDPYAVMVPTTELIRFYFAPSTRLAQALFWGEYKNTFDAERSGVLEEGAVKVHLRRWIEDQDAWTLARYICSPVMQREANRLYKRLQLDQINSSSVISELDQALECGFPFEGPTTLQGVFLRLPGPTPDSTRWRILRLEGCSAPFPFDRVIVDRDNNSAPGENAEDENLMPAWAMAEKSEHEVEASAPDMFQSNEEPRRGLEPLRGEHRADRGSLRIPERQDAREGRENCSALPFFADEGGCQPDVDRPRYRTWDVGREQPTIDQVDHGPIAGTETAGCSRAARQYGDLCASNRNVSGTTIMRGVVHWRRRRRREFRGT